jgi:hypothetical protein
MKTVGSPEEIRVPREDERPLVPVEQPAAVPEPEPEPEAEPAPA